MIKALLIGGPGNGEVVHIKAGIDIRYPHEEKLFEYRRNVFVWNDCSWFVWTHGEIPPSQEIYRLILKSEIPPVSISPSA